MVVRYGLGSFLSGCLIQLAIDNLTNVFLACLHAVIKTTTLFLQCGTPDVVVGTKISLDRFFFS